MALTQLCSAVCKQLPKVHRMQVTVLPQLLAGCKQAMREGLRLKCHFLPLLQLSLMRLADLCEVFPVPRKGNDNPWSRIALHVLLVTSDFCKKCSNVMHARQQPTHAGRRCL